MISLTIDCEEWNPLTVRRKKDKDENNTEYSRIGNEKLLEIFDKYNIKTTFFVTGYFAERNKDQIKKISKKHEIASHGYYHHYRNNPNLDLEKDIKRSKDILEKIINKKVMGFRAPQAQFSLNLIKTLNKLDFKYDSSLHPAIMPFHYNNSKYPKYPYQPIKELKIKEIPISVAPLTKLPIGWIFMRNIGYRWTTTACNKILKKNKTPVIYIHSWEFKKIKNKKMPSYYTRNTGNKFYKTLTKFIKNYKKQKFITLNQLSINTPN